MLNIERTNPNEVPAPSPAEPALRQAAEFMEALVAAYALMAHADGEVAPAERRRIFAILRDKPAMTVFSHDKIADEVALHEANFRLDPEVAQLIARERLIQVVGRPGAVHNVIAACRELIPADGVAHPAEYRALAEIRAILNQEERFSLVPVLPNQAVVA